MHIVNNKISLPSVKDVVNLIPQGVYGRNLNYEVLFINSGKNFRIRSFYQSNVLNTLTDLDTILEEDY